MHILTKYEVSEIVALRARMSYDGAPILLEGCFGHARDDVLDVAHRELAAGLLRFKIVRPADGRLVEIDSGECELPAR